MTPLWRGFWFALGIEFILFMAGRAIWLFLR
jgi:hypothetical protein